MITSAQIPVATTATVWAIEPYEIVLPCLRMFLGDSTVTPSTGYTFNFTVAWKYTESLFAVVGSATAIVELLMFS